MINDGSSFRACVHERTESVTEVAAYALRWSHISRSDRGQLLRFRRGCFDDWLAERPKDVPVLLEHGRRLDNFELRSELLSEPIGRVHWFQDDGEGLIAEAVYEGESDLVQEVLDAIRAGTITAYSCHVSALEVEESGDVTPDGEPIFDVVRGEVVECGPTHDPDDAGALIITIDGGITPGGEYLRSESSGCRSLGEVLDRIAAGGLVVTVEDPGDRRRAARQRVDDAERVAIALAKARRAADIAYADSRSPWQRADDVSRALQLDRKGDELDEALSELLCHDPELVAEMCAHFRVPPKVELLDRLKALAG
jgi:phage head maturation protease